MTSMDFAKALATLGGTLSARALGGPQASQQYLAQLNKQEEDRLARNYDAAQRSRDRMFQLTRDRIAAEERAQAREDEQAFRRGEREAAETFADQQRQADQTFRDQQRREGESFQTRERVAAQTEARAAADLADKRLEARDARQHQQSLVVIEAQGAQTRLLQELEDAQTTARDIAKHIRDLELQEKGAALSQRGQEQLARLRAELQSAEAEEERIFKAVESQKNRDAEAVRQQTAITAQKEAAALAHQQSITLARMQDGFRREADTRNYEFSAQLEQLRQQGALKLQEEGLEGQKEILELTDKKELRERAAATYYDIWGRGDSGLVQTTIEKMQAILPRNADGSPQNVDFNNVEQTQRQLRVVMSVGGFSSGVTRESYDASQQDAAAISQMTGGAYDAANLGVAERLKIRQRYTHAQNEAQALSTQVAEVTEAIEAIGKRTNITADEQQALEEPLARKQAALAERVAQFEEQYSMFTGKGAGLQPVIETLKASLNNAGRMTELVQDSQIRNLAGAYDPATDSRSIFNSRFLDEQDTWDLFNRGNAGNAAAEKWNAQALQLSSLSEGDLEYAQLSSADQRLIKQMREYGVDNPLDLQAINDRARELMIQGKEGEANTLLDMVQGIGRFNLGGSVAKIEQGRALAQQVEKVNVYASDLYSKSLVELFPSGKGQKAAIQAAIQKHGFEQPGSELLRGPKDAQEMDEFVRRYASSEEGMGQLVKSVISNLQVSADPDLDMDEQFDAKFSAMFNALGITENVTLKNRALKAARTAMGQDANSVDIRSDAEAIAPVVNFDFADYDRLAAAGSSLAMMNANDQVKWKENYGTKVLGLTPTQQEQAKTVFSLRDHVAIGMLYRVRVGIDDETPQQKRDRAQNEATAELNSRVVARDVTDMWGMLDRRFGSLDQANGSFASNLRQSLVGVGSELDGDYMFGTESLRQASRNSNLADSAALAETLERFDYIRAIDVSKIPDLQPAEREVLESMQKNLRGLNLNQAVQVIQSGISLQELGMDTPTPGERERRFIDAIDVPRNPRDMLQLDVMRRNLTKVRTKVANLDTSGALYADLDTRDGTDYGAVTPEVQNTLMAEIDRAELAVNALEAARTSPILGQLPKAIAAVLPSGSFKDLASLGSAMQGKMSVISGRPQDMMGMDVTGAEQLTRDIAAAETNAEGLDMLFNVFLEQGNKLAIDRLGASFAQATEKENKNMVARILGSSVQDMKDKVVALRNTMLERFTSGELDYDSLRPELRGNIKKEDFEGALNRVRDKETPFDRADEMLLLSFQVFLADAKAQSGSFAGR